jgi:TrmH family RNA methyltransferase
MRRIASRDNPTYKALLALLSSTRERERLGLSVLEGVHLCEAWSAARGAPRQVVVSESAIDVPEVARVLAACAVQPLLLADRLFAPLSAVANGVGLVFVVPTPRHDLPDRIDSDTVYLDRVQDPGNVGTLLRTCAAVGVGRVVAAPGTADCWSPKVLRAGMGAHFHLTIHEAVSWEALAGALRVPVRATALAGATDLYRCDLRSPGLWVFGQEGQGVDPEILAQAALRVRVPQHTAVESLNVGVAAAVCLFEQMRQRRD